MSAEAHAPSGVPTTRLAAVAAAAIRVGMPFWRSPEHWRALLLLATVVLLNLALVGIAVGMTYWQRAFYNALEAKDWTRFLALLFGWHDSAADGFVLGFTPFAVLFTLATVYAQYFQQALHIRWRAWLTRDAIDRWFTGRAYHMMSLQPGGADNPDQRIAEDVNLFIDGALTLGLGFMKAIVSLASFIVLLWALSDAMNLFGLAIPGYLVWLALLYSVLGTVLTHWFGRRLMTLNFLRQRREAELRYGLVRVRENADSIALHASETNEAHDLRQRLDHVIFNWRELMTVTKRAFFFITGFQQAALVFPLAIVAPAYFAGSITLGGIFQTANAFAQVQTAFSWIVDNYTKLADWGATIARLDGFMQTASAMEATPRQIEVVHGGEAVVLEEMSLWMPDGATLLGPTDLRIGRGERVLLTGSSGAGKSTLLRAIAGIWPFGAGRIRLPDGRTMFMPQRPYLPADSLRRALCYPQLEAQIVDADAVAALHAVELGHLARQLDVVDTWANRLSGGEQQMLAAARALLYQPDWLFVDEGTSSLDPTSEQRILALLSKRLPGATIVVVAHGLDWQEGRLRCLHLSGRKLSIADPTVAVVNLKALE